MVQIPGKRMIPLYIDESIYREIKVYAAETDQTFQEVMKIESDDFEQSLLKLVTTIKEMKRKADLENQRLEEVRRLATENPLIVSGHPEDPIGPPLEQPINN
jgi:hypothetical protein